MKRNSILFVILCASFSAIYAQGRTFDKDSHTRELVLMGGISFYIGDLNQTGYFNYQDPAAALAFRYNINKRFALRVQGLYGHVHASDADNADPINRDRNLSFHSVIIEGAGIAEFNFLPFKLGTDDLFTPYIFAGIGGFHFNPQAEYAGVTYNLRDISTEGEGTLADPGSKRYKLNVICIPFGMGFKWSLGKYIGIGIESGMRKTGTDYLDDVSTVYPNSKYLNRPAAVYLSDPSINKDPNVSNGGRQRGNSTTKDWYNFTGVTVSIRLPKKSLPCLGVQR